MDEQRADFEAWQRTRRNGSTVWWDVWQAATQRQQERIAKLEAENQRQLDALHGAWQQVKTEQRLSFRDQVAKLEAQVQALSLDAGRQPPADWSVFNSGAEVASGLSWAEAMEYMTPARLDRGWSFVCVADKSNLDAAIAAGKGDAS